MTTRAPSFRSLNQLTGERAESPVPAMLAAADEISGQAAECERLRDENAELAIRLQELQAEHDAWKDYATKAHNDRAQALRERDSAWYERDDLAERLDSLDNAHQITLTQLARVRAERDTLVAVSK